MKKFTKPAVLVPIIIGILIGTLLFIFGYSEDAPGMCLIGLSIAFLLIMMGLYSAGVIKKDLFAPIVFFCFGAGTIILSIVLLLDGEFGDLPYLSIVGVTIGLLLTFIGFARLIKNRRR